MNIQKQQRNTPRPHRTRSYRIDSLLNHFVLILIFFSFSSNIIKRDFTNANTGGADN